MRSPRILFRRRRGPRLTGLPVLLLLVLAGTAAAEELQVQEIRWAFDGSAPPQSFVPVSVLVYNESDEPFQGELELRRSDTLGSRAGPRLVAPLGLAPLQKSWIRFYVYLDAGDTDRVWQWSVHWSGTQRGGLDIERNPKLGPRARVLLVDRSDVAGLRLAVPTFPEELFPPSVTATDALGTLLIDHVPDWQQLQRQAFRDWLSLGGRVHVLHNATGRFPSFQPPLEMLNATDPGPSPRAFGNGEVHHHARGRHEVDIEFLEGFESRLPAIASPGPAVSGEDASLYSYVDAVFYSHFAGMTRPAHNWLLIFVLGGVYWLLLFLGGLVLGLKRVNYRIVLAYLVGLVIVFTFFFQVLGARSYDETATLNSASIARELSPGQWDVTTWSSIFVTGGKNFLITHEGRRLPGGGRNSGQLYATGGAHRVSGTIRNGLQSRFEKIQIPPFTSRPLIHRMKASGPRWSARVIEFDPTTSPVPTIRLVLSWPEGAAPPRQYSLQSWDTVYILGRDFTVAESAAGEPQNSRTLVARGLQGTAYQILQQEKNFAYQYSSPMFLQEKKTSEALYGLLHQPLLARALRQGDPAGSRLLPPDRLRLFVLADQPVSFQADAEALGRQVGRVLYVLEIPSETPR